MAYEYFYRFYDELMSDVPYEKYIELVRRYADKSDAILDLGCGTGNILIPLVKEGYNVDGLDMSSEMLIVTKEKLQDCFLQANLFLDDMRYITVNGAYDLIFSFLDTINYLTNIQDIHQTFINVYNALKPEGYFIFDVHSQDFTKQAFSDYSYNDVNEDYVYIWNAYTTTENEKINVFHDLVFFLKKGKNLYERLDEHHHQVVFPLDDYLNILTKTGFTVEKVIYHFDKTPTENNTDKIMLVAKKCR